MAVYCHELDASAAPFGGATPGASGQQTTHVHKHALNFVIMHAALLRKVHNNFRSKNQIHIPQ